MLEKHFIVETDAKPNPKNIIFYKNYRISILQKKIIRVEENQNHEFIDYPTQAIWYRNFGEVKYEVKEEKDGIFIKIENISFFIQDDFNQSYVLFDHQKKVLMNNQENLLSTFEGLDGCDGDVNDHYANPPKPIRLENGVCSRNGVAVLDDSTTNYLDEDGIFKPLNKQRLDCYIFAFGQDYQEAVKAFYQLSGCVPIIPRFALGNWWSRYHEYKEDEYLDLMDRFAEKDIPFTIATIDTDWHPSNNILEYYKIKELDRMKEEYGFDIHQAEWKWGWTGYSWDLSCFPNPTRFLKKIHQKNLKVALNLHPDTICWYEKEYPQMAKDLNINPDTLKPIPLDFENANFINAYYHDLHKNLEHEGVDFWWIDDNRSLFALSHYYFLDNGKEKTPLILCRYAGVGSHRYPLGFSGDSVISWKSLDYLPYFTATASNIGYSWWSHDIGAFMAGVKDDELYLRYLQLGVFSPILRLHCQNNETLTKEPWAYKNGIGELACNYLRLRHQMIPYLYSAVYRNHVEGLALIEPLYYYYPQEEKAYEYKNEYFFNGQLLVAPITKHSSAHKMTSMKVYLPKGKWTDIFTGDVYQGNKVVTMVRSLDSIPVLAKEGAIFILSKDQKGNCIDNPIKLQVDLFNGNASFTFYEDQDLKNVSRTIFETYQDKDTQYLSIMLDNHGAIPKNRSMVIRFRNICEGEVYCNLKAKCRVKDCLEVEISNVSISSLIELQVKYKKQKTLDILKKQAKDTITFMEGKNSDRVQIYDQLMNAITVKEFIQRVNHSKLSKIYKQRLKECK